MGTAAGDKPLKVESEGREGERLARRAGVVAFFTLASRILGLIREVVLAHLFGAGVAMDAYTVALTIPNALRRLVAEGSLMIAFVPILATEKTAGGRGAMRCFTGALLGVLIPVLLVISVLGVLFPEIPVKLFALGFDAERAHMTEALTRIMMPFIAFVSLVAVAGGVLNTEGIFGPTAAAPMLLNLSIISAALLGRSWFNLPVKAAAWGVLVGGVFQLVLQLPFLARAGMLVGPRWDLGHPSVRLLARRMGPALFGVAVYQLNIMLIRAIASFLPEGRLSCYAFATRIEEFALGVFAISISIAALPTLSEHVSRGDRAAVEGTWRRAVRATNFITVPAACGLFFLATPIVGVLFRHGQFTPEHGVITSELIQLMAFAVAPIGAVRVMVPTYYALGDTKTPVAAATASMVTTGVLGAALGSRYGIHGLTIATVAASFAQLAVLGARLRARLAGALGAHPASEALGSRERTGEGVSVMVPPATESGIDPSAEGGPVRSGAELGTALSGRALGLAGHALRCLLAAGLPSLAVAMSASLFRWFGGSRAVNTLALLGMVVVFAVVYFGLAHVLKLPEPALLYGAFMRRLRRRGRVGP